MSRLRIGSGALLVRVEHLDEWHARAILTPGLTDLDWKVLDAIREWYRRLYVEKFEGSLSFAPGGAPTRRRSG